MLVALCRAGSTSVDDRSRRKSSASKIPILHRRSTSLSQRPGSRCSRPSSGTENRSPRGNAESAVLRSGRNARPGLNHSADTDDRAVSEKWESVSADGAENTLEKSTIANDGEEKVRERSESSFPVESGNSHKYAPESVQILDSDVASRDATVAVAVTETSGLRLEGGTVFFTDVCFIAFESFLSSFTVYMLSFLVLGRIA